jgi:hypothetical protein
LYAIIKNNKVIATSDYEPCYNDLATRGEYSIICDTSVSIGHIYDGNMFSLPQTTEQSMDIIRGQRDRLLSQSDKYMLPDYPTGNLTREQWITKITAYRQSLRDFPDTCDINNPAFPTL